jgi:subtilisin family serine protease
LIRGYQPEFLFIHLLEQRMFKQTMFAVAISALGISATATAQVNINAKPAPAVEQRESPFYIVTFAEPGLMYNTGQFRGMSATAPSATGTRKLVSTSVAAMNYRQVLSAQRAQYLSAISTKLGRPITAAMEYDVTMNGVSLEISATEAGKISNIPGVLSVRNAGVFEINTDAGPAWIGAPAIWNGPGTPTNVGTRGQGTIIGVFDSGANQDHPSFGNDLACGYTAANPKVVAFRDCSVTACAGLDPEDTSTASGGHGVHTASTAAGNSLTPPLNVAGVELQWPVSGVAPCAQVITYKVCGSNTCDGSWIQSAIQKSIVDQVDVVNFSISGGTQPWADNDRGFLDMVNGDILVSASAGNTRAAPNDIADATVNHRGPWVLTVANSTHNRIVTIPVSVAGSLQNVPSQVSNGVGALQFATTQTLAVASALNLGNEYGCTASGAFAAGSMTGKFALIQRGPPAPGVACGFVEKINNAAAAGAVGVVIYDRTTGAPLSMDVNAAPGTTIPAVFIRQAAGYALRDYLAANPTALMTITAPAQRILNDSVADVLNASSLRGPNIIGATTVGTNSYTGTDTTKPDITAPGTNIYAAVNDVSGQFAFLTGTSMSSPHVAGAAALVRSANPTWSVPEVKSALMMTANRTQRRPDEATAANPDDVGSGRVDLTRAARVGAVLNETFANFVAAQPASDADQDRVRALNLPSYRNTNCVGGVCTFVRTFRNTLSTPSSWTVDTSAAPAGTTITAVPASFAFTGNVAQTQAVTFTVRITQAGGLPLPATAPRSPAFGSVVLRSTLSPVLPVGMIFRDGYEDPSQGVPLVLTVGIAGPQAP